MSNTAIPGVDSINLQDRNGQLTINAKEFQQLQSELMKLVANEFQLSREALNKALFDPRRDVFAECGYARNPTLEAYLEMYDRSEYAKTVVDLYPNECWKVHPLIYEEEEADTITPFEEAWDNLGRQLRGEQSWYGEEADNPVWAYLQQLDKESGLGRYGCLLIGIDDGRPLDQPVEGMDEQGWSAEQLKAMAEGGQVELGFMPLFTGVGTERQYWDWQRSTGFSQSANQPRNGKTPKPKPRKLIYLRTFPEHLCTVTQVENRNCPRYGKPLLYQITMNDPRQNNQGGAIAPSGTKTVHWHRILHVADTHFQAPYGEWQARPRLQVVFNSLWDLLKIKGSAAEGFWQACFSIIAFETHPQLGTDVQINVTSLREQFEQLFNGLRRWVSSVGGSYKTITPSVIDPTGHAQLPLEAICIALRCPMRVFRGSERGELASSQDDAAWNERIRERQKNYLTPKIIIPFIDRLIQLRVLPEPKKLSQAIQHKPKLKLGGKSGGGPNGGPNGVPGAGHQGVPGGIPGMNGSMVGNAVDPYDTSSPEGSNEQTEQARQKTLQTRPQPAGPATAEDRLRDTGAIRSDNGPGTRLQARQGQASEGTTIVDPGYSELDPDGVTGEATEVEEPESGSPYMLGGYRIEWPDVANMSAGEKAQLATTQTNALAQYIGADIQQVIPPLDYLTRVMGWSEEEALTVLGSAEAAQLEQEAEDSAKAEKLPPGLPGMLGIPGLPGSINPSNPSGEDDIEPPGPGEPSEPPTPTPQGNPQVNPQAGPAPPTQGGLPGPGRVTGGQISQVSQSIQGNYPTKTEEANAMTSNSRTSYRTKLNGRPGHRRTPPLEVIINTDDGGGSDCGTGAGGFQPGNTCGKGNKEGGDSSDSSQGSNSKAVSEVEAGVGRELLEAERRAQAASDAKAKELEQPVYEEPNEYVEAGKELAAIAKSIAMAPVDFAGQFAEEFKIRVIDKFIKRAYKALGPDQYEDAKGIIWGIFSRATLGMGPLGYKAVKFGIKYGPPTFRLFMSATRKLARAANWTRDNLIGGGVATPQKQFQMYGPSMRPSLNISLEELIKNSNEDRSRDEQKMRAISGTGAAEKQLTPLQGNDRNPKAILQAIEELKFVFDRLAKNPEEAKQFLNISQKVANIIATSEGDVALDPERQFVKAAKRRAAIQQFQAGAKAGSNYQGTDHSEQELPNGYYNQAGPALNAFCPTGEGGGVDNSCDSKGASGSTGSTSSSTQGGYWRDLERSAPKELGLLSKAGKAVADKLSGYSKQVYNKLPGPVQRVADLGLALHSKMESFYDEGQRLAHAIAKERGYSDFEANRAAKMLALADGVSRWVGNWKVAETALTALSVTGGPVGVATLGATAKLSYYVPVASLAFVGFQLGKHLTEGKNPFDLIRSARERVHQARTKTGVRNVVRTGYEDNSEWLTDVMEWLGEVDDGDTAEAMLVAALDETKGDKSLALELAKQAYHNGITENAGPGSQQPLPHGWVKTKDRHTIYIDLEGQVCFSNLTANGWVTLETDQRIYIDDKGKVYPSGPPNYKGAKNGRDQKTKPSDQRGSKGPGTKSDQPGQGVERKVKGPNHSRPDSQRKGDDKSASRGSDKSVPAKIEHVNSQIDRYAKFFRDRGQHEQAEWMEKLREHVNKVGTKEALRQLEPEGTGRTGEEVTYEGGGDWMGQFAEGYLNRVGIFMDYQGPRDETKRLISSAAPSFGATPDRGRKDDYLPKESNIKDKLEESQYLGLPGSKDIKEVLGYNPTHLTPEVVEKLDREYGKNGWVVKPYGDSGFSSQGVYFPQRAERIAQDARNTIWSAGENIAKHGFELERENGKVVGLKHRDGQSYRFGTDEYNNSIYGDVRHWGDKAAEASQHEHGAALIDGGKEHMVQKALEVVGVSEADRAAGKVMGSGEARVHIVTKNGKASIVPHTTWIKGEHLPVVFETPETRAIAKAALEAINKLPASERQGQVYGPDVMRTKDGYTVIEANPANKSGSSGYLGDNPIVIDSYISHLIGKEPEHVRFIRKLLTAPKGKKSATRNVFCATGEGGGVDPTCSPKDTGG
ncbi:MAG: hypothetical protein QXZ57_06970 [Nitrososphaerota archaeon]